MIPVDDVLLTDSCDNFFIKVLIYQMLRGFVPGYVHTCTFAIEIWEYLYFLVYCRNVPHSCSKEMTSSLGNDIHKISLKMTGEFMVRIQNRRSKHKARVRDIINCLMKNGNVTFERIRSNSVERKSLFLFHFCVSFCSIHGSRKVRKNFFDSVFQSSYFNL